MAGILFCALQSIAPLAVGEPDLLRLVEGDRITGHGVWVKLSPEGKLDFTRIGEVSYRLAIDANGTRRYLDGGGSPYWVYDAHFGRVTLRGVDIPDDQRLPLIPPSGELVPGMRWQPPVHEARTSCGPAEARFEASVENGPDVTLLLDGREVVVKTLHIVQQARLRCAEREPWLRVEDALFSPDLHEIVQQATVNYADAQGTSLQMADPGRGWRLRSITTAARAAPR